MPTISKLNLNPPKKKQGYNSKLYGNPFYQSKEWKHLRQSKLLSNRYCEICEDQGKHIIANTIDHWKPIRLWEELKLSIANLVSMCTSCHNRKSRLERDIHTQKAWLSKFVNRNILYDRG